MKRGWFRIRPCGVCRLARMQVPRTYGSIQFALNTKGRCNRRGFATKSSRDLYTLLEISSEATDAEIKSAFYKKAQEYHPDKGGDPKMFLKVMAAYEVLKDKERRQFYASSNMRGLEDLFGGDSVFAEGREKDLQAFMARYSKKYQHILDEFEAMLRENEHIKQQVRDRSKEGAEFGRIVEGVLGSDRIMGHLLNDWADYFPDEFSAVETVGGVLRNPFPVPDHVRHHQHEHMKHSRQDKNEDVGDPILEVISNQFTFGSVNQGKLDKQDRLYFLFGGPNLVVASSQKENEGGAYVLRDSKGGVLGRIIEKVGAKGEVVSAVADKEGYELMQCRETSGWLTSKILAWDTADGGKVAIAKCAPRSREGVLAREWRFDVLVEAVHPCFYLFTVGYHLLRRQQEEQNNQQHTRSGWKKVLDVWR